MPSTLRSLAHLLTSIGIKAFSSIFVFLVAAKVWPPQEFGQFMLEFAAASLLVIVCEYGFTTQILSSMEEQRKVQTERLLAAKIWLAGFGLLAAYLIALMAPALESRSFLLLYCGLLCTSFLDFFCTHLRATHQTLEEFRTTSWTNLLIASLLTYSLSIGTDRVEFAQYFFVCKALQLFFLVTRKDRMKNRADAIVQQMHPSKCLATLKGGRYHAFDTATNAALGYIDTLMLARTSGVTSSGIYQAAARFNQGIPLLFSALTSHYLPRLSNSDSSHQFRKHGVVFAYLSTIGGVAILLIFVLAWYAYSIAPPDSTFNKAAPYFVGLGAIAILRIIAGWMSTLLIAAGKQKQKTYAYALTLATIISTGSFFIQAHDIWGIIYAYGLGYCICIAVLSPATFQLHKSVQKP